MLKDVIRRLVVVDIDGLRRDVFESTLSSGMAPVLARILGGTALERGISNPALSVMPSVTFACQASIFTGAHPGRHGVTGNEMFDRLGRISHGVPRHFGFDVGETLAVDDAVNVFRTGLAGELLSQDTPTLYERAALHGWRSSVVHHMYARGAHWIKPSLTALARLTKGPGRLGLSGQDYDREMVDKTLEHLAQGARPEVLTVYFMGLDHHSHAHGPASQGEYLANFVDGELGRLLAGLEVHGMLDGTLFAVVSDHGQIAVVPDDRHSLRIGFPVDREMGYLFDALGLDVHDYPGEGPDCSAVCAANGGTAHVYLHRGSGTREQGTRWSEPPRFAQDVLPVARAFLEANESGRYSADLQGALALVLARDAGGPDGWASEYRALRADGGLMPVEEYLAWRPEMEALDAANRLRLLAGPNSGDVLLLSNYSGGFYFGGQHRGVHGGLHAQDSSAVQALALPSGTAEDAAELQRHVRATLAARCAREGQRKPSIADLVPCLEDLLGWAG